MNNMVEEVERRTIIHQPPPPPSPTSGVGLRTALAGVWVLHMQLLFF